MFNHIISVKKVQVEARQGENMSWRFKFDNTTQWHIHKPDDVLENETNKILRDFEIQMDQLIPTRRLKLISKKKKKEKEKRKKFAVLRILAFRRSTEWNTRTLPENFKKTMEHKGQGNTNCFWYA